MKWHILNSSGEVVRVLNEFDSEKEDLTGLTVVQREIPISSGWKWDTTSADYVVDSDLLWRELRAERDRRLSLTDWWERPSVIAVTDPELHSSRMSYCQQLRDLPDNTIDPADPEWPTPPV